MVAEACDPGNEETELVAHTAGEKGEKPEGSVLGPLTLPNHHVVSSRQLSGWRTERTGKDVEKHQKGEGRDSLCKHEAQSWRPEPGRASKAWGPCVFGSSG